MSRVRLDQIKYIKSNLEEREREAMTNCQLKLIEVVNGKRPICASILRRVFDTKVWAYFAHFMHQPISALVTSKNPVYKENCPWKVFMCVVRDWFDSYLHTWIIFQLGRVYKIDIYLIRRELWVGCIGSITGCQPEPEKTLLTTQNIGSVIEYDTNTDMAGPRVSYGTKSGIATLNISYFRLNTV